MGSGTSESGQGETLDAGLESPDARVASDPAAFADGGSAVADLLARAFRDNPMNRAVLRRSPRARVRANRIGARMLLERARAAGHVLVAAPAPADASGDPSVDPGPSGALVGFSPLRPPPQRPSLRQLGLALRQGLGASVRWGAVQAELASIRPTEAHWTLAMLGVDPRTQGRGLGASLVERWIAETARVAAPAWVETDRAELVPFYRRFGFEPESRCSVYGVEVVGLLRPAP